MPALIMIKGDLLKIIDERSIMLGMALSEQSKTFRLLLCLLGIKACCLIAIILYAGIELGPDEAQYWTWSRALDWGYYSKPPGISWQIWLGTRLFGSTELGVRFFSVVLSFFQALSVYALALQAGLRPYTAFWCGLLMAFTPLGVLGSFLAITDNGFILCWTLACICMASALRNRQEPNPFIIGLLIACGALFKWPIYFFWLFFVLARWAYFSQQPVIKSVLGVCVSLVGLLPSLWWNWSHDWATFRHVSSAMQGGHASAQGGNAIEFIGAQFVLASPILFILVGLACWALLKQAPRLNPALVFCGGATALSLIGMAIAASGQKIQGNWGIFAYPTSFVVIGWFCCEWRSGYLIWMKRGIGLAIVLMGIGFALPYSSFLPYRMNPFKHNQGWTSLNKALAAHGYDPARHFLVSDKYQTTSLLSFYGEGQKRAYFLNVTGARNNQFSYWPSLQEEQKDKTGYFVLVENAPHLNNPEQRIHLYQEQLNKYFQDVEFLNLVPLRRQQEEMVKGMFIFRCHRCLNAQPKESALY